MLSCLLNMLFKVSCFLLVPTRWTPSLLVEVNLDVRACLLAINLLTGLNARQTFLRYRASASISLHCLGLILVTRFASPRNETMPYPMI